VMLYRVLSSLLHPFIPLLLRKRLRGGKELPERMSERVGVSTVARPNTPIVWIHAASMGEVNSVLPLIERITQHFPALTVLLTTVTVTSSQHVASRLPERVMHQFVPVDTPQAMTRFFQFWKPSLLCLVDSEFWPNMLMLCRKYDCHAVVLNARISQRSARRWAKLPATIRTMLGCFSLVLAKSAEDAARLKELGALHVRECGNLKFSAPALPALPADVEAIVQAMGARPVWLTASTHPEEEIKMLDAHLHIREKFPDALLVIVPRHAVRGVQIVEQLRAIAPSLTIGLRSAGDVLSTHMDVYVADTMGELGLWYRAIPVVCMGGSFVPHGGQNPFEPALLGAAVLCGAHMHNFKEFCAPLHDAQALWTVQDTQALAAAIQTLFHEPERVVAMGARAQQVVQSRQHALNDVWSEMQPLIEGLL